MLPLICNKQLLQLVQHDRKVNMFLTITQRSLVATHKIQNNTTTFLVHSLEAQYVSLHQGPDNSSRYSTTIVALEFTKVILTHLKRFLSAVCHSEPVSEFIQKTHGRFLRKFKNFSCAFWTKKYSTHSFFVGSIISSRKHENVQGHAILHCWFSNS